MVKSGWGKLAVAAMAMIAVATLAGCPGVKPIKELLDDSGRYEGETVRIAGEVTESIGGFGVGAFQVNDGTGTLTVVTKAGSAPSVVRR